MVFLVQNDGTAESTLSAADYPAGGGGGGGGGDGIHL